MAACAYRRSARVIVVDAGGSVLLFRVVDAMDRRPPIWITPGGGVEPGLAVNPRTLGDPIAVSRGNWTFRGRRVCSEDWFFALRAERFDPSTEGWSDLEHELHESWRWWTPYELQSTNDLLQPGGLATVVHGVAQGQLPAGPIELPWNAP